MLIAWLQVVTILDSVRPYSHLFCGMSMFYLSYLFTYTSVQYDMMFVSFNSNTTAHELLTLSGLPEFTPGFFVSFMFLNL
jgi:hypothetical protein